MADNCLIEDVNGGKRIPKRRDLAGPQPSMDLVSGLSQCPCGGQDLKGLIRRFGMCSECMVNLLRASQDVVSRWKRLTDEPGWDNCEWDGFAYALGQLKSITHAMIEIPEKAP